MISKLWQRRIRKLSTVFRDKIYRKVLFYRVILSVLNVILPRLRHISVRDSGLEILYDAYDRTITLYALAMGNYHKREFNHVAELLEERGYPLGGHLLEIGGNIGSTTVGAVSLDKFSMVHVFEPLPSNVDLIRANLAVNNMTDRVSVVPKALSNSCGKTQLAVSDHNRGDNRLVGAGKATSNSFNEE